MENLGYLLDEKEITPVDVQQRYDSRTYYRERKRAKNENRYGYRIAKRSFDIVGSIAAIVISAIPMLIIALLIFLQDGHNPIFKQTRVTKDGRFFTMYKFRTMHVNAEAMLDELCSQNEADGPVFKMKNDPRVMKIGRFLRRASLDEIPQFFNVLNGTMSFVGPRPPLPQEMESYTPYQLHRLDVKGGITCYWQCSGRSNIMFDTWVELDLKYIRECSAWVDFKILLRTVVAILKRDGAE